MARGIRGNDGGTSATAAACGLRALSGMPACAHDPAVRTMRDPLGDAAARTPLDQADFTR